ncbi:tail fiber assembly protein [Escherichia coli]|uniref:tail fiber assembly protein n=1 Tax=Escherichia coli TaxID=562 RepID=UPI00165D5F4B|nr:tail fiber assembly protein [Escherichia coli]
MNYYKKDNAVWAFEDDQLDLVTDEFVAMTEAEIELHLNPPITPEDRLQMAEDERNMRINSANDFMNARQWPGKAAIGRLKGEELAKYNLWLDYLDILYAVDVSAATDIEWPTPPAVQDR